MNKGIATAATSFGAAAMLFGAVALAQPASGAAPVPAQATPVGTPVGLTPSAGIGTATAVSTALATGTASVGGTGTAVVTGTATVTGSGGVPIIPTIPVPAGIYKAGGGDFPFANPAFKRVWDRTDGPVAMGQVSRTWFWGPSPNTVGLLEQYNEAADNSRQRLVQYFDKSRMEINNPNADASQPFFVTNGLLTVELISGYIQVGENSFTNYRPACIPMTGDFGDTTAPTYNAFQKVSNTQAGDHNAPDRKGQKATETIDNTGKVMSDTTKGNVPGVELVYFENQTKHNIPKIFWDFLNSSGPVHNANGQVVNEQLIQPWFYASGLPISEPYWTRAKIGGQMKDVMIQAFQRRALTYVPTNAPGWQVEMANIGQHYFDWRYRNAGYCAANPVTTPTAPVPVPSGTVQPGGTTTPSGTGTPQATTTAVSGTPGATNTVVPGTTATVARTSTPTAISPPSTATPTPGAPQGTPPTP